MKSSRRQFVTGSLLVALSAIPKSVFPLSLAPSKKKKTAVIPGDQVWGCAHTLNRVWDRNDQIGVYTNTVEAVKNLSSSEELLGAKATLHLSNGQTFSGYIDHLGWFTPSLDHPVRKFCSSPDKPQLAFHIKLPTRTSGTLRTNCTQYAHLNNDGSVAPCGKTTPSVVKIEIEVQ